MSENRGWIEVAREDERSEGPYRYCFPSGVRFALSANDAIRAQKINGAPFKPPMQVKAELEEEY